MSSNTSHTWEQYEKENKRNGVIASVLIHAVLIVLFFFFGLSHEFPPPVAGILLNFGTSQTGAGDTPPEVSKPVKQVAAPTQPKPATTKVVEEKVVTQDVVEAPAVKQPEKQKEEVKQPVKEEVKKPEPVKEEPKKPVKEEPKVDEGSIYSGAPTGNDNPGDEGITYGPGDQGDPEGDIKSKNYYGENTGLGDKGDGPSHDLTGRDLKSIPSIDEHYTETGKIAVTIKVDRQGNVVYAKYTQKGSTSSNARLIQLAEEAARQAKFSPNSKAAEEQFGTIVFTFKLK